MKSTKSTQKNEDKCFKKDSGRPFYWVVCEKCGRKLAAVPSGTRILCYACHIWYSVGVNGVYSVYEAKRRSKSTSKITIPLPGDGRKSPKKPSRPKKASRTKS